MKTPSLQICCLRRRNLTRPPPSTTSIFFTRAIQHVQTNAIIKRDYHHCQCLFNIQWSFIHCCGELLEKDELHPDIQRRDVTLMGHLSITNNGVIICRIKSKHSALYWCIIIRRKKKEPTQRGRRGKPLLLPPHTYRASLLHWVLWDCNYVSFSAPQM